MWRPATLLSLARTLARTSAVTLAVTLAVGLPAGGAWAAPVAAGTLEAEVGGGYDSNLFLEVAADPSTAGYRAAAAGFLRVAPRLRAGLAAGGSRLALSYEVDLRATREAGLLALQEVSLSLWPPPPTSAFDFEVALVAARFDAVEQRSARFLSGGLEARAALRFAPEVRLATRYSLSGRVYPDPEPLIGGPEEVNLIQVGELRLLVAPSPLFTASVGATYLGVGGNVAGARLDRLRGGLELEAAPRAWLGLTGALWAGLQAVSIEAVGRPPTRAPARDDTQLGGALGVRISTTTWLDVLAAYEAVISRSSDPASGYSRQVVLLGLAVHATGVRRLERPRDEGPPAELAPVVDGARVRLRLRLEAPPSRPASVRVVGSWNDWSAEGAPLEEVRPGLYEVWIRVGPGVHRYRFLVDGRPARPPAAPRYVPDDFGGEDGLIEVPPAAERR